MRTYKSERYRVLPDHKRPGTWIVVDLGEVSKSFYSGFFITGMEFSTGIFKAYDRLFCWPTKSQAIAFVELLEATV